MDMSQEFIDAAFDLAESLGGTLTLTSESMLVIMLPDTSERADRVAAGITNDDFPFCYVIPHNDWTLRFEA